MTLFVTTHYMDEAERCTDVGYIYQSKLIVCGRPDELKKLPEVTPAGTRRWELEVPAPAEQLARLRKIAGVRDATLFGQAIHVLARETLSGEQLLVELQTPPDASHARQIEPTLEDVFVTLSRAAEEEQASPHPIAKVDAEVGPPQPHSIPPENAKTLTLPPPAIARATERPRPMWGFGAILIKEFFHIRRQPSRSSSCS